MRISDILTLERTLCNVDSPDKQAALTVLAGLISSADPRLTPAEVLNSFWRRESQGSTGFGKGVALPHGRLTQCSTGLGAFIRLTTAVNYNALDGLPVQLLFAVLMPDTAARDHLDILAKLAEKFSDVNVLRQLQSEPSSDKIYHILIS